MTSKIKVDNIADQTDSNIVNKCGTNITLGASGDTINLASGASQSGFGRTGTVDWDTGSIKTGTFTAVNGEGYFVDTSGGVSTANLPAGSAGAIVSFADYTRTFQTNNLTITPNGSEKIGGVASIFLAATEGQSITLVYVDATEGWINTTESTGQSGLLPAFITATGGTITTVDTDYKVHTFTGPGTFTVTCAGNPLGSGSVDYMIVAGGAGGGANNAGGGGAGGFREGFNPGSYTASPLATTALPVTATGFPITVGGGGAAATGPASTGASGSNSIFSTITSAGGGGGASQGPVGALSGGSGGGGSGQSTVGPIPCVSEGGAGNTPATPVAQGTAGGFGITNSYPTPGGSRGGGGGGATVAGSPAIVAATGGNGGTGATTSINATPTARAGGGGGSGAAYGTAVGGTGGAGGGGSGASAGGTGCAATVNTGGGGGGGYGGGPSTPGGAGGSGIVIIRYKFQ